MDIRRFNIETDDINPVAELILTAYEDGDQIPFIDRESKPIVMDLVEAGNNFLGHENIYLCYIDEILAGLVIGYTGKSISKLKTLFDLLIKLKLTQVINYLLLCSQMFDTLYTPNIDEDDFYISVIVVDEKYRNQGIGAFMLSEILSVARNNNCKKIVLDVSKENHVAKSLYKKFGFINVDYASDDYYTMEYSLN